jgi:hypothetical protein
MRRQSAAKSLRRGDSESVAVASREIFSATVSFFSPTHALHFLSQGKLFVVIEN